MAVRGRPRSFDRDAALRRAMELFWARGYDNTSMAELGAAMGIASPSLYAAFHNKAELFREASDLYLRTEGVEIWQVIEQAPTAREAIEHFLARTARSFTRPDVPRGCLIVLGALNPDPANVEACADLRARRAENLDQIKARLDRAVAEGELRERADTAAMARFYVTVQQGMSVQARDGATCEELMQVAACALAAWPSFARAP